MNKMPRHHHYPRPPAYGAERDPLLQSSSSSSPPFDTLPSYHQTNQAATYRPGSHVRGSTESGRSTAGGAAQRTCRCIDLNVLFIVLFGALAGTSLWLVVKSARPNGVSSVDWYFAGLMALAEWALEVVWVMVVWPQKVWRTEREEAFPKVESTVRLLSWVKVVLFVFNWIFAFVVVEEKSLPFSWGLAWIADFILVDFALAVVLGLFCH